MFEVFNTRTCETIGYVPTEKLAQIVCRVRNYKDPFNYVDYINADEEPTTFDSSRGESITTY